MALLVSDDLWAVVEPLLPRDPPKPKGGRPRASDRAVLAGILFVLRTDIQWQHVPTELGCCGKTCWRRLGGGMPLGFGSGYTGCCWSVQDTGALDWHRAALNSASLPAKRGRAAVGPNLTDRGRPGRKRHLLTDAQGTPLGLTLSGANCHDSRMLLPTLDVVPNVLARHRGRPRRRPGKLHADKAYDHRRYRSECRARGIIRALPGVASRAAPALATIAGSSSAASRG
ncbi:hypothetical protein HMPREF9946_01914 [Acetobacteraceae bacterium AT-5844]|nr:hypothetical protein HMPREF9946_01914 [Acetobacteraceae bacterium AT-5844]